MSVIAATSEALALLVSGDAELWSVIGTSLSIALLALLAASIPAFGLAYLLASRRFVGHGAIVALIHALLAMPTVTVGLILFMLLSKAGPLGALGLLFTPGAIALGQFCIALPILAAFAYAALKPNLAKICETSLTLGASRTRMLLTVAGENARSLSAAMLAGFGRIISEVGCALLVGGNIAGSTRTIPTAIALDTAKGQYAQGIALGLTLLVLAMLASASLFYLQKGTNGDD